MITTLIKHLPSQRHGRLHGYRITQIINGRRSTLDVLALNGRAALDLVRQTGSQNAQRGAA